MDIRGKTQLAWALLKANPILTLIAVAIVALLISVFAGSIKQTVQDWRTDRAIEKLDKKSNDLQQKASEEIDKAAETRGARKAEDEKRRTEIRPAIEKAARTREQARAAKLKAQHDYETSVQKTSDSIGVARRDLHERNCREFAELYPADLVAHCIK